MKTKKYLKIASLAVVAAIFIWTFVFLYRKSQPTVKVYETIVPETADLEKTTVATGKVEPRDEVLIKPPTTTHQPTAKSWSSIISD